MVIEAGQNRGQAGSDRRTVPLLHLIRLGVLPRSTVDDLTPQCS